ncbi:MAG: hypothetical protein M3A44_03340 [Gammaproteobacteria bacterium]
MANVIRYVFTTNKEKLQGGIKLIPYKLHPKSDRATWLHPASRRVLNLCLHVIHDVFRQPFHAIGHQAFTQATRTNCSLVFAHKRLRRMRRAQSETGHELMKYPR